MDKLYGTESVKLEREEKSEVHSAVIEKPVWETTFALNGRQSEKADECNRVEGMWCKSQM